MRDQMRNYPTGATRGSEDGKLDFDGFLSPLAMLAFAEYMHEHRSTPQGLRPGDNWKKGIPRDDYMKSMWRHFFEVWSLHHSAAALDKDRIRALCALRFNVDGMLHELLSGSPIDPASGVVAMRRAANE